MLETSMHPKGTDIASKYRSCYLTKPELKSVLEYQVYKYSVIAQYTTAACSLIFYSSL